MEKRVERTHALLDPPCQLAPFRSGDDAGNHIERDQPFFTRILAIDVEGDADAAEEAFGLGVLATQPLRILPVEPLAKVRVSRPNRAVRGKHFIELRSAFGRHRVSAVARVVQQ